MTDSRGVTKGDATERSVCREGAMRGRSMRLSVGVACSEERAFPYGPVSDLAVRVLPKGHRRACDSLL